MNIHSNPGKIVAQNSTGAYGENNVKGQSHVITMAYSPGAQPFSAQEPNIF